MRSFVLLWVLVGCAKSNYQDISHVSAPESVLTNTRAKLVWVKVPTETSPGEFDVHLDSAVLSTESFAVTLWMPAMGHGSSPVQIQEISKTDYHVSHVYFIMPGEWEIRLQIKDGARLVDQTVQKITI